MLRLCLYGFVCCCAIALAIVDRDAYGNRLGFLTVVFILTPVDVFLALREKPRQYSMLKCYALVRAASVFAFDIIRTAHVAVTSSPSDQVYFEANWRTHWLLGLFLEEHMPPRHIAAQSNHADVTFSLSALIAVGMLWTFAPAAVRSRRPSTRALARPVKPFH